MLKHISWAGALKMSFKKTSHGDRFIKILLGTVLVLFILSAGQPLFVPLCIALLISFFLYPLCLWLERKKVPALASIFLSLTIFILIIASILMLLFHQFSEFMKEWPALKIKLDLQLQEWETSLAHGPFKVFLGEDLTLLGGFMDLISDHLFPMLPVTLYRSSIALVLLLLIPVYVALILYYREVLVGFLYEVFPVYISGPIKKILPGVIVTYYNFIKGMGLVYLLVGILNSIGLALIGIPNPIFFGFIASILTFIPYVGITIGALLPMAISWLAHDSIPYPLGIVLVFTIVQVLEANVIFPLAVSYRLKINALMTLVVIIAGGILWGAIGMVLFRPLAGILKLVADHIEEWRAISILLGTKEDLKRN